MNLFQKISQSRVDADFNNISKDIYIEFAPDIIKKAKDKFIYSIYNENTKLTLKNEIESLINKIKNKHC